MCVLSYARFVCISAYANVYIKQHPCVRGPLRECRSIRPGASGLPYYCAPIVCVSQVIELLAVWWHDKLKTNNQNPHPPGGGVLSIKIQKIQR